jgi:superfamily II DNA/RNA helicase
VSKFINKTVVSAEPVKEYVPQNLFADFALDESLKKNVARKGYTKPTPIQDQSIPLILEGKDLVGIANTGTGKTAAFLLPLLHKVLKNRSEKVLILAPTRELAQQIKEEFIMFASGLGLTAALCIGGANIMTQIKDLRRNVNFIIGTPGRIKDLIQRRVLNLSICHNVVLDEADRMLDMGFIPDIRLIFSNIPQVRQTLFFSATLPREVEGMINDFLKNPERISVKVRDTAATIHQDVIRIEGGRQRVDVLEDLLVQKEFQKVLVFGRTKHGVEKLSKYLNSKGFKAASIHGNKTQNRRQAALNDFKANRVQVLIATDVAARGLDIADVSHVINYDLPATYDDYIHRIGRTGRADKAGIALTFVG